ncbi:hypothetical protein [Polyangium sp. y55x31]|uniref:hypothetical protein n=1 Tax=Polyangium sp. y55x31 TaxID=3042688 RepID=UPI0024824987|nr:hypothetical protein [Polyangium sp. y55x31]MDI1482072.1 hypothetical protein [Polyangium sp. y55x31]
MSATDSTSAEPARGRRARVVIAALLVISALGFAAALVSYRNYAAVWLRPPPRLPPCVLTARRLLSRDEPVTGSIPHVTPDGNTVYLRPAEDRAVSCLGRMSSKVASAYAAAFAELEPTARARALAAALKNQVPQDASADREALASWLLASAAMRALPETPETTAARDEIDQMNACRFAMRSTCPTRPPIPIVVWAAGVPSSLGLLFGAGVGVRALVRFVRERRRRRKAA